MVNSGVKESERLMALRQILHLFWNCSLSGQGFISATYWMCKIEMVCSSSEQICWTALVTEIYHCQRSLRIFITNSLKNTLLFIPGCSEALVKFVKILQVITDLDYGWGNKAWHLSVPELTHVIPELCHVFLVFFYSLEVFFFLFSFTFSKLAPSRLLFKASDIYYALWIKF